MNIYKSSIFKTLFLFAILPMLALTIGLTVYATDSMYKIKKESTKDMLSTVSRELAYSYEQLDDGSVEVKFEDNVLFIGDTVVSKKSDNLKRLKKISKADVSLFYNDVRIATTLPASALKNGENKMTSIWNDYVSKGESYFNDKLSINGVNYFAYYSPVSINNEIIGMAFAGIPTLDIIHTINVIKAVTIIICVLVCLIMFVICVIVAKKTISIQESLIEYVGEITKGKSNRELDTKLIKRKDEYGEMSKYLIEIDNKVSDLIQKDALTGLNNRRAAMIILSQYVGDANKVDNSEPFTFVIGDIDYFKKVNDTYGHTCGDIVLKAISSIIGKIPEDEGFAARWGGEEFVMVYKGTKEETCKKVEKILDEIRGTTIEYDGNKIGVTMTFGVCQYIPPQKLDALMVNADRLLYKGKDEGRNQIVS